MSAGRGLVVLVLAAGQGKRMRSDFAKVLHPLAGRPLLHYVLDAVRPLAPDRVLVVIGHQRDQVAAALAGTGGEPVVQAEQLGTGHAVQMAVPALGDFAGTLLVVVGDAPLLGAHMLEALLAEHRGSGAAATVLTARLPDPGSYGRIVRGAGGDLERIVESGDATVAERKIDEINSGMYAFEYPALRRVLGLLAADNAQGEYYLTDTIALLRRAGHRVRALCAGDYREVLGINTARELREAEAHYLALKRAAARRPAGGG